MTTPKKDETLMTLEVDIESGIETLRELTLEEIADFKAIKKENDAREAEAKAKAEARASALAKLAELGLTEEEIAAL